ncbi:hypothetical protein [Streptomyces sp. NPDC058086]|uniref:hypothetical protein n=1 Tax=Streptomyces sp. NPDC058086 TaxID=3346334 RepID=UPI0036E06830
MQSGAVAVEQPDRRAGLAAGLGGWSSSATGSASSLPEYRPLACNNSALTEANTAAWRNQLVLLEAQLTRAASTAPRHSKPRRDGATARRWSLWRRFTGRHEPRGLTVPRAAVMRMPRCRDAEFGEQAAHPLFDGVLDRPDGLDALP